MININKLFPRLSVRVKLAIVLALVALGPLAAVSIIGARETINQIQSKARITLEHDLAMAEAQTSQTLGTADNHIDFIAKDVLGPLLGHRPISESQLMEARRLVEALLSTEPSLYRVKLIDADGRYQLVAQAAGSASARLAAGGGEYYAWLASSLAAGSTLVFAVEVSGPDSGGVPRPIPAVAILHPIRSATGEFLGAVVGEAYASILFSHLDQASTGFAGVTGLVDAEGHFLYHSIRKRNWATLLAARDSVNLRSDFPEPIATEISSGRVGTVMTPQTLISYRPVILDAALGTKLLLYRVVPLAALAAPVRYFILSVLLAAGFVVFLVLGLAILAADQFTRPIFRIRDAAWQLARGEPVRPLGVNTNDEIEDLARDFALVAEQIGTHRAQREAFLAERTHLLERTHAELTDILEHAADGIIGVDPAGTVRVWNHGAEQLFGYASEEAVGAPIDVVLQPATEQAQRERVALRRELLRDGAVVNFLTEVIAKDHQPIQISLTETLISGSDGRPLGSSLIVRDNRVQSRLEEQMRRSERLAAISMMAAGLAHEINNPLAIIGNRIECIQRDLQDKWPDTTIGADIAVLQQHVERLRELTSSLLRFARDDQRDAGPIALDLLAEATVTLLRRTIETRHLRLELVHEPPVPTVVGYEKAVETVLVNLLLNAADATPPGGTITLVIRAAAGGKAAEIEVRDTGPGVPPALRERIFEPFFTTKAAGHGTGLGLTVCRGILDRHGGSIRVDSTEGDGCRFVVTLPLHPIGATWHEPAYS